MSKCTACGDKPENTAKDFTKAVIEINNPETLVLLRKVVIPASMGDDTDVVPAVGKYHNVILQYEANGHIYLYSSDGIPTAIESNVPQEVLDQIAELENDVDSLERADQGLQQEIDELKNSPDVVDIVATYSDLMAYDTSSLGDNDVIRVLRDETHDGQSAYYRWDKPHSTWTFIGTVGDYYTKQQVDTLLDGKQDELTPGENISIVDESGSLVISATDTTYTAGTGLALNGTQFSVDTTAIATQSDLTAGLATKQDTLTAGTNIQINNNTISATDTTYSDFTGTDGTAAGTAGLVPAPATTDAGKFLKADGTWDTAGGGSGPTVVQTTGTSQADVMSQNAATSMVFADPATATRVSIGNADAGTSAVSIGQSAYGAGEYSVALGYQANTYNGSGAVALGQSARARASKAIAIGYNANSGQDGGASSVAVGSSTRTGDEAVSIGENAGSGEANTVAVGRNAKARGRGSVAIGDGSIMPSGYVRGTVSFYTDAIGYGYNGSSNYRLLTGLYDPQSAHDAATKGYVDTAVAGAGASAFTTNEWNALWA